MAAAAERGEPAFGLCMKQCSKEEVVTVAAERGELAFEVLVKQFSQEEFVMSAAERELAVLTKFLPADSPEEPVGGVASHQRDLSLSSSSSSSFLFSHPRLIHSGLAERGNQVQCLLADLSFSSLTAHHPGRVHFSLGKLCCRSLDFRKQRRTR